MFAPKITLFNGIPGTMTSQVQRPFVISLHAGRRCFSVGFQPIIRSFPEGVKLAVQAVVSADRRYVRLSLLPLFTNITDVFTFSFVSGRRRRRRLRRRQRRHRRRRRWRHRAASAAAAASGIGGGGGSTAAATGTAGSTGTTGTAGRGTAVPVQRSPFSSRSSTSCRHDGRQRAGRRHRAAGRHQAAA